jgi:hypothetical protein
LLTELLVVRIYAGLDDSSMVQLEVTTALATADLTYSKLKSVLPERGSRNDRTFARFFDGELKKVQNEITLARGDFV